MDASVSTRKKRRKKIVYECPNPLFEKWLITWKEEAVVKGWKVQHTYAKALRSLQRYPLPLQSGKEAKVLEHFGDKLCKMLDDKLMEHKNQLDGLEYESGHLNTHSLSSSSYTKILSKQCDNNSVAALTEEPTKKKRKKSSVKRYIPAPRSGAHALLITLLKHEIDKDEMSVQKKILIDSAQPLCDKSFTVPDPGSYYTAWSVMGTLIKKELVIKSDHPPKFSLTDLGRELAITLTETDRAFANEVENLKNLVLKSKSITSKVTVAAGNSLPVSIKDKYIDITEDGKTDVRESQPMKELPDASVFCTSILKSTTHPSTSVSSHTTASSSEPVKLYPGTFDIILCVDNCEVCTGISKNYKQAILSELKNLEVKYDIRKLHVGDFLWIARKQVEDKILLDNELVLDYIVERKRLDDLAQSIKDGRFHEQKFRLRNCGIRKPIYLIEEYYSNQCFGIPESSLNQAIINTQIVDGFLIKRTKDVRASVRYLTMMTRYLQSVYSQKTLISCRKNEVTNKPFSFMLFNEFNSSVMKNKQLTIKEMFAKHLLQMKGLSVDKAIAIVEKYPTPAKLLEAYSMCESPVQKEKLLEDIKYGRNKRRIGIVVSKALCRLYCTEKFSLVK